MGRPFTPHIITEDSASGAQIIDGSLRFDKSLNQYLTRTPSTNGNRRTWTLSLWQKRVDITTQFNSFLGVHNQDNNEDLICIDANQLRYRYANGNDFETEARLTDAGWYHIVVTVDSTLSTSSDRIIYYVNGTRQDVSSTGSEAQEPSLNYEFRINNTQQHAIGKFLRYSAGDYSGYMTQYYLIDGQALGPENFGFTDLLTNTWRPKKYSGTFGTNGFYLPMDGNSPIGEDKSGNGNNWTPVNFDSSVALDKTTAALPILNTTNGGHVAIPGVRPDSNASSIILAVPLAGDYIDYVDKFDSSKTPLSFALNAQAAHTTSYSNFYGGSYTFDGNSDSVHASPIPNNHALFLQNTSFTAECWARIASGQTDDRYFMLLASGSSANSDGSWYLRIYQSKFQGIMVNGNTQYQTTSVNNYVSDKWTHIAYVREGNEQRLYIDGVLEATTTHSVLPNVNNSSNFFIGSSYNFSNTINAQIQDVRIYDNVAKYTSNFAPASTDPDVLLDSPSGVDNSKLTRITDGAVAFDGSGDYLEIPNSTDFQFGTDDWTIEFFWNGKPTGSYTSVITTLISSDEAGTWRVGTRFNSTNKLYFARGTGSGFTDRLIDVNVNDGRWYHIAFVRSSGVIIPFVDGVDRTSDLTNGNLNDSNSMTTSNPVKIGYNQRDNAYINGFLSNLRVIKGTALYTANFTPPTRALTNVTNTKLLCCQSNKAPESATVAPNIGTYVQNWTENTSLGLNDFNGIGALYDGELGVSNRGGNNGNHDGSYETLFDGQSVAVSSTIEIYWNGVGSGQRVIRVNGTTEINGGSASSSSWDSYSFNGTVTKLEVKTANTGSYAISAIRIDNNILTTPLTANGNAVASNFAPFNTDINKVRGQESSYCTFNSLYPGDLTLSDGNLKVTRPSGSDRATLATFGVTSGKWYWETTINLVSYHYIGVGESDHPASNYPGQSGYPTAAIETFASGQINVYNGNIATGGNTEDNQGGTTGMGAGTLSGTPTIGVALDLDSNRKTLSFYNDGILLPILTKTITSTNTLVPAHGIYTAGQGNEAVYNFGQKPFKFTPPDGYQALNGTTLRNSSQPNQYFNNVLYTGTQVARTVEGLGFQPDLVWIKVRSEVGSNALYDSVRGATRGVFSNRPDQEEVDTNNLTSFDSDGFSLGTGYSSTGVNGNGRTYVAWCWKAGTPYTPTVTGGFSSPSASINREAGFGIYKVTGANSQSSFTTGLNQPADFILAKALGQDYNWGVYHRSHAGSAPTAKLKHLNENNDPSDKGSNIWLQTGTTIEVNSYAETGSNTDYVYYVWHNVPGVQKFGSYVGNGSADGPFVECGFKPAFIIVKHSDGGNNWFLMDTKRDPINPAAQHWMWADSSNQEVTNNDKDFDILSNGFKPRLVTGYHNDNNVTYIYMAWAEVPQFGLYGGQANGR